MNSSHGGKRKTHKVETETLESSSNKYINAKHHNLWDNNDAGWIWGSHCYYFRQCHTHYTEPSVPLSYYTPRWRERELSLSHTLCPLSHVHRITVLGFVRFCSVLLCWSGLMLVASDGFMFGSVLFCPCISASVRGFFKRIIRFRSFFFFWKILFSSHSFFLMIVAKLGPPPNASFGQKRWALPKKEHVPVSHSNIFFLSFK